MRRIKIFLGGYYDAINAQNINCTMFAEYLDHVMFEPHLLYYNKIPKNESIIMHRIRQGVVLKNLMKLYYMFIRRYDIYFLPKLEKVDLLFARLMGKKRCIVSSIESRASVTSYYDYFNNWIHSYFCISEDLQKAVKEQWHKSSPVLYLGCKVFENTIAARNSLQTIIFVGNIKANKRPFYFIECAEAFPSLNFIMVGDGDQKDDIADYMGEKDIKNITLMGRVKNDDIYEIMGRADLLLITSESEGLPKVVLEAASVGVPTIYINEYYFVDYIENGVNGYGVSDLGEMKGRISELLSDGQLLSRMSRQAYERSKAYDWTTLIKDYERYFMEASQSFYIKGKRASDEY